MNPVRKRRGLFFPSESRLQVYFPRKRFIIRNRAVRDHVWFIENAKNARNSKS